MCSFVRCGKITPTLACLRVAYKFRFQHGWCCDLAIAHIQQALGDDRRSPLLRFFRFRLQDVVDNVLPHGVCLRVIILQEIFVTLEGIAQHFGEFDHAFLLV